MAEPYSAERDAVSLTFLRRFYDTRVRPEEQAVGGAHFSTDTAVKRVIMRDSWDAGDGRARRMAELLQPGERWAGPESGTDMCAQRAAAPGSPGLLVAAPGPMSSS